MSYSKILQALNDRLATVTGLPVDVQHENDPAIKTDVRKDWCRTTLIPAETTPSTLGVDGVNELQGLFQVDLFSIINEGPYTASDLADTIMAAFPRTLQLTQDGVTVNVMMSWREVASRFDSHYMIPIAVRWHAFI